MRIVFINIRRLMADIEVFLVRGSLEMRDMVMPMKLASMTGMNILQVEIARVFLHCLREKLSCILAKEKENLR